jgi:hypothetical protein
MGFSNWRRWSHWIGDPVKIVSAILGLFVGLTVAAHSAPFSVTNLADSGAGSLRQAIMIRRRRRAPTRSRSPGVTGTITLQSILPTISGELTISGPGSSGLKVSCDNRTQYSRLAVAQSSVSQASHSQMSRSGLSEWGRDQQRGYAHHRRLRLFQQLCVRRIWRRHL